MTRFKLINYREKGISFFEYAHSPEFGLASPSPISLFLYESVFSEVNPESLENLRLLKTGDVVQLSMDLKSPRWASWNPPQQFKNISSQPVKLLFKLKDKRNQTIWIFDGAI